MVSFSYKIDLFLFFIPLKKMVLTESQLKADRKYKANNREKINEKARLRRAKNPERQKAADKKYKEKNPEKVHKTHTICEWKRYGIIDENYEELYDLFINETKCWICLKEFTKNKMDLRCLDHDHETGEPRYIVCNYCNFHVIR